MTPRQRAKIVQKLDSLIEKRKVLTVFDSPKGLTEAIFDINNDLIAVAECLIESLPDPTRRDLY